MAHSSPGLTSEHSQSQKQRWYRKHYSIHHSFGYPSTLVWKRIIVALLRQQSYWFETVFEILVIFIF